MGYYPIWEFFWNWENPVGQVGEVRLSNDFLANGKGNLLRGIDNCSGAAQSVILVRQKALDNSFSNIFFFISFKSMKEFTKKVAHVKRNDKNVK